MAGDPSRSPVIAGVAQVSRRPAGPGELVRPIDLMAEAGRAAVADAGNLDPAVRVDRVGVVESLGWRAPDAARLLAGELGLDPDDTVVTATGGNGPLSLLHEVCDSIAAGDCKVALIAGAEAFYSRRQAQKWEMRVAEPPTGEGAADRVLGEPRAGSHEVEIDAGLALPTQIYPLFSTGQARAAGRSPEDERRDCAELWSRFSEVAASNPYAWTPQSFSAEEIAAETAENRMVAYPYTKRMCANIQVDQGAALVVMSAEAAATAGIEASRLVHPLAGAESADEWFVGARRDLHSSPAIRSCWGAVSSATGLGAVDLEHIDLYSCFPSAVRVAAAEIGLEESRQLTLTGGLAFAGGPGNAYCLHSLAAAVEAVRRRPGPALVTGVGWYLTKHAMTILGPDAAPGGWQSARPPAAAGKARPLVRGPGENLQPEAFTVLHDRGGPAALVVTALAANGARHFLRSTDAALMAAARSGEQIDLGHSSFS